MSKHELNKKSLTEILKKMEEASDSCCKVLVLAGIDKVFAAFTETSDPELELRHSSLLASVNNDLESDHVVAYAGQIIELGPDELLLADGGDSLSNHEYSYAPEAMQFLRMRIGQLLTSINSGIDLR